MRIANVVGARPNLVKIAPLLAAYRDFSHIEPLLFHTGQHSDQAMSGAFFEELRIARPDENLGVGGASHAVQTARIMVGFEEVCLEYAPDLVLVVGDVNSTLACGLVAAKLGIRLAHVEAGLRSFDKSMPEEINRRIIDAISDLHFASEESALRNLEREGVPRSGVHFVGNVMVDTLLANRGRFERSDIVSTLGLTDRGYATLTLHRPGSVGVREVFERLIEAMARIATRLPIVFPAHPYSARRIEELGLADRLAAIGALQVIEPLGYTDFLALLSRSRVVLTDSGGVQEEATVLEVPCVTLRDCTERPVTCEVGSNRIGGTMPDQVLAALEDALAMDPTSVGRPPLWDGRAAQRIVSVLARQERGS